MSPLPEGMTPSQVGDRAEAAILAALVAAGQQVLIPFGQHRYDLAYLEDGGLVRVQCKSGVFRKGAVIFRTHSVWRGAAYDYRDDADVFGVYCHDLDEIFLVPVEEAPNSVAHLRLDPPRNAQKAGLRWAERYRLKTVIEGAPAKVQPGQLRLEG